MSQQSARDVRPGARDDGTFSGERTGSGRGTGAPAPRPGTPRPLGELSLSRATLDRAAHLRTDAGALADLWADPRTRTLVVAGGQALVREDAGEDRSTALVLAEPADAPDGERAFLGLDVDGGAYFAVGAERLAPSVGDARAAGLREVGSLLDARDAGMLVHAVALFNWHASHTHCPRCGTATEIAADGHLRRCPRDGSEHYPRTDPAVIMAVVDGADRLLLGHQATWPAGRFSTLAGFVEPGESLEMAVAREVAEETAVVVDAVDYAGSQPWPFPSSLMLGFFAHSTSVAVTPDGVEITDARWFTRDQLAEAVEAGDVLLPARVSIARRLIESWYGDMIPDPRGR
jgi:NAD+ diphosphatase